jgi:hypothetical protein
MEYLKNNYPELENITKRKGIYDYSDVEYFIKKYYQTNWDRITIELETKFNMRSSQSCKTLDRYLGYNI